jgi:hypothetical protein
MPTSVAVRSGPVTAVLQGSELRDVRVAGLLALDAVYAAVRDAAWGTVPGELESYDVTAEEDRFLATFVSRHTLGEVDLRWDGRVEGHDGLITFRFEGVPLRDFAANRIGFCLLHPLRLKNKAVEVRTPEGTTSGRFPDPISPHQPFLDVTGLRCEVGAGAWLDIEFEGDLFEMEDHRNWTDPGWKTYCTPLRRGFPFKVHAGRTIRQTVTLSPQVPPRLPSRSSEPSAPVVCVRDGVVGQLPALGLLAGAAHNRLDDQALAAVARLRPAYLYVELAPNDAEGVLNQALAEAAALQTRLDLGLVGLPAPDVLEAVAAAAAAGRIGRVAVFDPVTSTTPPRAAMTVRTALGTAAPAVTVGGGSRAFFAELNRARLPLDELDFVTYGICPQVHHTDDRSVLDTLAAQPDTVRDARRIAAGRPVVAGPVTLRMRFNPYTATPAPAPDPDPRQGTDFAAAWTVGALAALRHADAVTLFETTGPRGVVGRDASGQLTSYPVWHVLAALAEHRGADLFDVRGPGGSELPGLAALGVRDSHGRLLLVANLGDSVRVVTVDGLHGPSATLLGTVQPLDPGHLALPPYAVAAVRSVA